MFVNILIFYCWFSGPPSTIWFYPILHSLVWKIGSFGDFSRKNFQRCSHAAYLTIQIENRPCLSLQFSFQCGCKFTKDTINFPEKATKISHFYLYYDRTLLLFSRPMRYKDTSALREMFQYFSLAEKPLDQWEIATHWRPHHCDPHLDQPKLMTFCPWQLMVSLQVTTCKL